MTKYTRPPSPLSLLAACAVAIVITGITMCSLPAMAHGEFQWVMPERNPVTQELCCGPKDCHYTDRFSRHRDQYVIYLGGIPLPFPVAQTKATKDHHGKAVVCLKPDGTVRCFFIPLGV